VAPSFESGVAADARRLGEGGFPPELDRVNWGAVFLSFFWALSRGLGTWAAGLFGLGVAQVVLTSLAYQSDEPLAIYVVAVVNAITGIGLSVFVGVRANRIVWNREQSIAAGRNVFRLPPRESVAAYVSRQRVWAFVGAAFLLLGFAVASTRYARGSLQYQRQLIGLIVEAIGFGSLFVLDRIRLLRRGRS
jgi:hypothetical protein